MGDNVTPSEFRTAVAAAARNTAAAQTTIAAQSTQIERLLSVVESITKSSTGAGTPFANFASPHAPNASPSAGTMSDGTPTELSHGSHSPAHRQVQFVPAAGQSQTAIAQSVTGLTTCSPKTASHFSRCRSNS